MDISSLANKEAMAIKVDCRVWIWALMLLSTGLVLVDSNVIERRSEVEVEHLLLKGSGF